MTLTKKLTQGITLLHAAPGGTRGPRGRRVAGLGRGGDGGGEGRADVHARGVGPEAPDPRLRRACRGRRFCDS